MISHINKRQEKQGLSCFKAQEHQHKRKDANIGTVKPHVQEAIKSWIPSTKCSYTFNLFCHVSAMHLHKSDKFRHLFPSLLFS